MSEAIATNQTILVVGGGISGLTAALEAAGFQTVRVGCTTLRVETAAVAAASVIVAHADALGR